MAARSYGLGSMGSTYFGTIRWSRAVQSGLIVGAILFLLTRGIPWIGSGAIDPAIMGREVASGQEPSSSLFFSVIVLHFLVSVLYALIIAPIVHGFRPWLAGFVGGIVGLVLYFISYAASGMIVESQASQREWTPIILHVVFGIFCAETYKGMVRRRPPAPVL